MKSGKLYERNLSIKKNYRGKFTFSSCFSVKYYNEPNVIRETCV